MSTLSRFLKRARRRNRLRLDPDCPYGPSETWTMGNPWFHIDYQYPRAGDKARRRWLRKVIKGKKP